MTFSERQAINNEFYSWDGDETNILYCPMCGRRLEDDD